MESKDENDSGVEVERLKEQVQNLEKLASLGMLSAGIAHEIQNPLNFVINFSKMSERLTKDLKDILVEEGVVISGGVREEVEETLGSLRDNLQKICEHGERAVSVIRGILLYARGKEDEFVTVDACQLVKEYVWLSYHAMRAGYKGFNISIRENYADDLPKVELIPQDFSRAVLNLINNACYALLTKMEVAKKEYQPFLEVSLYPTADGICLVIEDNGTGIPQTVKEKIFTPFFTTKPVGEGTGLGLSITRSIVEEKHGGEITVESEEGEGTRFEIRIKSKR